MTENNVRRVLREDGSDATQAPVSMSSGSAKRPAGRKTGRSEEGSVRGRPSGGGKGSPRRRASKNRGSFNKFSLIVILAFLLVVAVLVIKVVSYIGGISHLKLSDKGFDHDKRYENCAKIKGIDVSEFQDEINWKKVKSSGADFVFIRAGFRSMETGELKEDADFRANIKAACRSDIMVGAYIFSQAINKKEAEEEAEYLMKLVRRYDIDMPLVIDYELIPGGRLEKAVASGDLFASGQFNDITEAFCRKVEKEGYESAIYGNYDMFTNYMDATLIDKNNNLWVAQYGGSCDVKADYWFWQATDSARLDGISGGVDMDFWYLDPGKVHPTRAKGKKKQTSIGKCEVKFADDTVRLKNHRALPDIRISYDGKKLRKGKDYEVSYVQNTEKGTGYAVIRGIRKYRNWTAVPFTIE